MDIQKLKEELIKQIEISKKNAIEEIQKDKMIPAMWSISELIDLKAQLSILNKLKED